MSYTYYQYRVIYKSKLLYLYSDDEKHFYFNYTSKEYENAIENALKNKQILKNNIKLKTKKLFNNLIIKD